MNIVMGRSFLVYTETMWTYPLPAWVNRGVAVRCSLEFTAPCEVPDSTFTVCAGELGRVLSVDERNVRVYIGPADDLMPETPEWTGSGEPVEPYRFVDHMRGDFHGIWTLA